MTARDWSVDLSKHDEAALAGKLGPAAKVAAQARREERARHVLDAARRDLGEDLGGFSAVDLLLDQGVAESVDEARVILRRLEERAWATCPQCGVRVRLGTCCPGCDVLFGDPCEECGGIGYHERTCPALDRLGDEAAYR